MAGSAGLGRPKGSRNRLTQEAQALAVEGETPVEFGLRLMRDVDQPMGIRLVAAKLAAPYLHPRPAPASEKLVIKLPDTSTVEGVGKASAAILAAVARGDIAIASGRDLVGILDAHRKGLELVEIERRIAVLEQGKA